MPTLEPRDPRAPDAGPWGTARDLDAMRRAVDRAEGRGFGNVLIALLILAIVGAVGAWLWIVGAMWLPMAGRVFGVSTFTPMPAVPAARAASPTSPPTPTPSASRELARP